MSANLALSPVHYPWGFQDWVLSYLVEGIPSEALHREQPLAFAVLFSSSIISRKHGG